MSDQSLMNTYGRQPISFERGNGIWLFDNNGNRYLDAISSIAVCGLGHCHPAITKAMTEQANKLVHCSNLYHIPEQQVLANSLTRISGMSQCFFANSGAEANEAAIKLARLYGHKAGIIEPKIIVMEGSFHGRTIATLSATANRKVQAGFEPLLKGFIRTPLNDISTIEHIAASSNEVVAVMLEPVQGEGGIRLADKNYLQALRKICDNNNWLLILDEVQTGNGRTGSYFAYQQLGIAPDIVTTAKGLGNGFPIGACLATGQAENVFTPGTHGSTFGGNPLACKVASAVVDTIVDNNLPARAAALGKRILDDLNKALSPTSYVKQIRGLGLMIGIEMVNPCPELVPLAKTHGLLVNVTAERVIRLLPPLILTDQEADFLVSSISRLIKIYAGDDRKSPR
ncbi:MAG: aspartate aminotransferase family protein [Gammaproteobacteria bacterium]|nr:MAG: aspartate aminotransferase family protein [Gammaproteobacteria bacterium]